MAEPSWQEWIVGNLSAGCDPADMQARMTKAGWSEADARAALATGIAQLFPGLQPSALALPVVPDMGTMCCGGRDIRVILRLASPAVALCENVLSPAECTQLLEYAHARGLAPSTVVDEASGDNVPHPERTSSGLMLRRGETALIERLERRLAELIAWPVANGEACRRIKSTLRRSNLVYMLGHCQLHSIHGWLRSVIS